MMEFETRALIDFCFSSAPLTRPRYVTYSTYHYSPVIDHSLTVSEKKKKKKNTYDEVNNFAQRSEYHRR